VEKSTLQGLYSRLCSGLYSRLTVVPDGHGLPGRDGSEDVCVHSRAHHAKEGKWGPHLAWYSMLVPALPLYLGFTSSSFRNSSAISKVSSITACTKRAEGSRAERGEARGERQGACWVPAV